MQDLFEEKCIFEFMWYYASVISQPLNFREMK